MGGAYTPALMPQVRKDTGVRRGGREHLPVRRAKLCMPLQNNAADCYGSRSGKDIKMKEKEKR
jgi:hypothetical protein